VQVHGY